MTSAFPGALDSFSTKVDAVDYVLASHINSIQEGIVAAQTAIGQEGNTALCEGRLTLTTAVPVTTADVTNAGTIYFTPFRGNRLALHDGTGWVTHILTEISIAVPNTVATMYDVFCYSNAGTPTLEALVWTNDTTRATALTTLDGVLVKTGATTRRYLGSFRTDDNLSAKCTNSLLRRYLWNYYNRVMRPQRVINASSHTYNVATWRPFNNSQTSSQVQFVIGVLEDAAAFTLVASLTRISTDGQLFEAIGLNSITADGFGSFDAGNMTVVGQLQGAVAVPGFPQVGYNYACALELSTVGASAGTFAAAALSVASLG